MLMWFKGFFVVLVVAVLSTGTAFTSEKPEQESLVRKEMAALDNALKTTIEALVLNDPGKIPPAFDEVRRISERLDREIRNGRKIALPKNQKRFKEFVRLDHKFHHDLKALLTAANKNNASVVLRQTHRLLDACVRCHTIFRN
jgi:cytochrome c556